MYMEPSPKHFMASKEAAWKLERERMAREEAIGDAPLYEELDAFKQQSPLEASRPQRIADAANKNFTREVMADAPKFGDLEGFNSRGLDGANSLERLSDYTPPIDLMKGGPAPYDPDAYVRSAEAGPIQPLRPDTQPPASSPGYASWGAHSRALAYNAMNPGGGGIAEMATSLPGQVEGAMPAGTPGVVPSRTDVAEADAAKPSVWDNRGMTEAIDKQQDSSLPPDALLVKSLDMSRVMIELPGPWISDVRSCDIEDMKKALVNELGPDVNLANVPPASIIDTEATRTGLGTAGPPAKPR